MNISTAWSRPRAYSLYPQKRRHHKRLYFALIPVLVAGAWFAVPKRTPLETNLSPETANAQSVAVAKSETTSASTLSDTPASTQQQLADARYSQLQDQLNAWSKKQPISQQWSVVVQDVNNDANRASVNDRSTYYMASVYKLFLTIPLSQKYPFESWRTTPIKTENGNKLLEDCIDLMISRSDNPCGEGVGEVVGWVSATKAAKSHGMTDTSLSSSDLRSSARDVTNYMLGLERGTLFSSQTRESLLDSLSHQKLRSGIPAGCSGCTVWNKTGDLNGVKHDTAIVQMGNKKFVLTVMSNGGGNNQIADVTRLITGTLR